MESNLKITVPKPCHENWDKMTPEETGRFCNSCAKSVVDFTGMKTLEIQDYFIKNKSQNVCGRFRNEQLDRFDIQIPQSFLKTKMPFHRAFVLALFIAMGSTLFSCKNHDGATLGEVSVVNDTVKSPSKDSLDNEITGKIEPSKRNSLIKAGAKVPPIPPLPQKSQKKGADGGITGDVILVTSGIVATNLPEPKPGKPSENEIYSAAAVEVKPNFPGGIGKFYEYVNANLKITGENKAITAKFIFSFVVNTDGSLSDIKLLRGVNETLDKEALSVLKSSPKWIPGEQNGQKVRVSYSLPIKITAQE